MLWPIVVAPVGVAVAVAVTVLVAPTTDTGSLVYGSGTMTALRMGMSSRAGSVSSSSNISV